MADKVRVGVIGTGQIGKRHVERYTQIPEAEIVALCDLREDEVKRVAQQHGVSTVYIDYKELLARDDIQSVDVCVHNRTHAQITIDGLEAGKNVYCEKPMSWTYTEAKDMYDTAQRLGNMLHIQLGRIYRPETRAAKRLIDEGYLGKAYYAQCYSYRRRGRPFVDGYGTAQFVDKATSGGGTMLDTAVYDISRMMYLLDCPEVLTVSGATYQETDMYEDRRESSGYNVEELGLGLARLAGGITMFLEGSWAIHSGPPGGDRVMGSKGGVHLDPLTYHTTLADMEMDGTFDLERAMTRWRSVDPLLEGYDNSQKHWVWAQLGWVPLLNTAELALRTSQITEGVYLSAALGREVTAAEIEAAPPGAGR